MRRMRHTLNSSNSATPHVDPSGTCHRSNNPIRNECASPNAQGARADRSLLEADKVGALSGSTIGTSPTATSFHTRLERSLRTNTDERFKASDGNLLKAAQRLDRKTV